MKRIMIVLVLFCLSAGAWGQNAKVRTAREYLEDGNYKKAIPLLNEAVAHEETKGSADAWYWRGIAYLQWALDSTEKANLSRTTTETTNSFLKALDLNPSFGPEINNPVYYAAMLNFNLGVEAFGKKAYAEAYNAFMTVPKLYNVNGGTRFATNKSFTDLVHDSKLNAAFAALNAQNDDQALALLVELKDAGTVRDSNIYSSLIEIYKRKNNDSKLLETIKEARRYFPNSAAFRNHELNYYITTGKQDELMPLLEAAVQADPNNAELWFNLANAYERMAYPKDAAGAPLAHPANMAEYISKAENAYLQTLRLRPDNPDYNYNLGVLYYEAAGDLNRQLSAIKGTSAEENKKYDELVSQRDQQFDKALPYFEKAYSLLDPKAASLNEAMKITYRNSMIGLREIYSRKGNKQKADEMKTKLSEMK